MSEHEVYLLQQLAALRQEYDKAAAPIIEQLARIRQYDTRPIVISKDQIAPEFLKQLGVKD